MIQKTTPPATEANLKRLLQLAESRTKQAKAATARGDMKKAENLITAARAATRQAEDMKRRLNTRSGSGQGTARYKAAVNGMAKFLGVNVADVVQYVTSEDELKEHIQAIKNAKTVNGVLNKVAYCKALNEYRGNMLFTISELEKGIQAAKKEGNNNAVAGYETAIKINRQHAEIIAQEIRKNGGKVDK